MKKLALSAILGASLMVTSSAFALTSMSADNMKAATGQAGVSITLDNILIEQFVGSTTYTDSDGTTTSLTPTAGEAGSIRITDKHVVKEYLGITSGSEFDSEFLAATTKATKADWVKASALTIDVGNCAILADGLNNNANALDTELDAVVAAITPTMAVTNYLYTAYVAGGGTDDLTTWSTANAAAITATVASPAAANITLATRAAKLVADGDVDNAVDAGKYLKSNAAGYAATVAGVVIGLPTIMINTSSDEYSVGVGMAGAINDGKDFIKITKGASSMMVLSGVIEIAAH